VPNYVTRPLTVVASQIRVSTGTSPESSTEQPMNSRRKPNRSRSCPSATRSITHRSISKLRAFARTSPDFDRHERLKLTRESSTAILPLQPRGRSDRVIALVRSTPAVSLEALRAGRVAATLAASLSVQPAAPSTDSSLGGSAIALGARGLLLYVLAELTGKTGRIVLRRGTVGGNWMMSDRKIGIAALLIAVFPGPLAAEPAASAAPGVQYRCSSRQNIIIERDRSSARVTFGSRTYVLWRKASDLGQKYLSSAAALIIDGPSAVFVADDGTDLGMCIEAVPVASAH
jgi:hypothetical protein